VFTKRASRAAHFLTCKLVRPFGVYTDPKNDNNDSDESDCCEATANETTRTTIRSSSDPNLPLDQQHQQFGLGRSPLAMVRVGSNRSLTSQTRQELEDCLDLGPFAQASVASGPEKALVVAWDTAMTTSSAESPPDLPTIEDSADELKAFSCSTCGQKTSEILGIIAHLKEHCGGTKKLDNRGDLLMAGGDSSKLDDAGEQIYIEITFSSIFNSIYVALSVTCM